MSLPITPITFTPSIPMPQRISATPPSEPGVFGALLNQSIATVETTRTNAAASIDRLLSGEGEELHRVALSTQQAELSFDLFMQVRNKVVSAYQDVMRMQI